VWVDCSPTFYKTRYEKKGAEFFIFLEFCAQGSFWELIHERQGKPFSTKELAYYAGEVAAGLAYLHQNKIYHRDIKVTSLPLKKHR